MSLPRILVLARAAIPTESVVRLILGETPRTPGNTWDSGNPESQVTRILVLHARLHPAKDLPSHPPAPQAALTAANVAVASSDVCKGKVCCGDGIARVVEWGVVLYGGRCIRACGGARDVMLVASLLLFLSLLFSSSFCRRTRVLLPSPSKPTSALTH